ncbi:hypothetical protein H7H78_01445 [Mycobacterium shinjukuense]|uniref:hypothetical protein n=1 Tax=Mycobacterium shinjukuense TaxID=398694 RepID=UPI0011504FAA|nr:hypothetical protein [Mycobacterium shinjukuense]MCV6984159.1 hypothetical protein [Mycobacterium shinjukuense]
MVIDPKDAFVHVIYDHRYLSLAGAGWALYGPDGTDKAQERANAVLPGIGAILQDSVLLHARALIEFYTKGSAGRSTDITLWKFDRLAIDNDRLSELERYKKPVEVHVLHLTEWRDSTHRKGNDTHTRPDWNADNTRLVQLLLDALQDASNQASTTGSKWKQPFSDLHTAATNLLADPTFSWPHNLTEGPGLNAYLAQLL